MKCYLCPNGCGVDRAAVKGVCGCDDKIKIAKYYLHPYEEPPISGTKGSGTVFFCGCNLKCVFCQNYELSRNLRGKTVTVRELADIFKRLEDAGAHNINLVTPTHYADKIIEALSLYKPSIPIVYKTGCYEKEDTVRTLFPYVDVFLPDIKFYSPEISFRYCGKRDYFAVAEKAVKIMMEKPTVFSDDNLIKSGVIVRHLVLPQCVADSKKILDWFSDYKEKAMINIMSQYTPFGDIERFPELKRKVTAREYDAVIDYAISLGINNAFFQSQKSVGTDYIPNWDY